MPVLDFIKNHVLELPFWMSVVVLAGTAVVEFFRRAWLKKHASRIFLYAVFVVGTYLIYVVFLQFQAFLSGPLGFIKSDGFLNFVTYTLGYARLHYLNDYLISFLAAILFALIGGYFNKKYNERFFEKEELYLLALGILLTGYPGFIFYIPLTLFASAIVSAIFVKHGERLPLYHFWVPTALAVVFVIHFWASNQVWWNSFRF